MAGMVVAVAIFDTLWMGLKDAFLMAWEVWWALVLGCLISAIVQAWVPRERIRGVTDLSFSARGNRSERGEADGQYFAVPLRVGPRR